MRLELDEIDPNRPLFSGISVTVRVDTGYRRSFRHPLQTMPASTAAQMSATLASSTPAGGHRAIVVAALMATYMQAVNISLPNAALLHIQGALSMADDEVGWIFTSYIAASAMTMPMTRWLAGRHGRKAVYQTSLAIFAFGLVLATRAETTMQFIAARVVQGAASGPIAPLSMAILLDMLPPARHARITLVWTCRAARHCSAARASAAGSANITAGARSSMSACR